jgi:hypothetical protein
LGLFQQHRPKSDARIADAGNIYLTMMDRKRPKRLRRPLRFSAC